MELEIMPPDYEAHPRNKLRLPAGARLSAAALGALATVGCGPTDPTLVGQTRAASTTPTRIEGKAIWTFEPALAAESDSQHGTWESLVGGDMTRWARWTFSTTGAAHLDFAEGRKVHAATATYQYFKKDDGTTVVRCPDWVRFEVDDTAGVTHSLTLEDIDCDHGWSGECVVGHEDQYNGDTCIDLTVYPEIELTGVRVTAANGGRVIKMMDVAVEETDTLGAPLDWDIPFSTTIANAYPSGWTVVPVEAFAEDLGAYSLPEPKTLPARVVPGEQARLAFAIPNPDAEAATFDVTWTAPACAPSPMPWASCLPSDQLLGTLNMLESVDQADLVWRADIVQPIPTAGVTVAGHSVGHLFLELEVPEGTSPGVYQGVVHVTAAGGATVTRPIEVTVADAHLHTTEEGDKVVFAWEGGAPCNDRDELRRLRAAYGENGDQTYQWTKHPIHQVRDGQSWTDFFRNEDWAPDHFSAAEFGSVFYTLNGASTGACLQQGSSCWNDEPNCIEAGTCAPQGTFLQKDGTGATVPVCPAFDPDDPTATEWGPAMAAMLEKIVSDAQGAAALQGVSTLHVYVQPIDEPYEATGSYPHDQAPYQCTGEDCLSLKEMHQHGWLPAFPGCAPVTSLDYIRLVGEVADWANVDVKVVANPVSGVGQGTLAQVFPVPVQTADPFPVDVWMPLLGDHSSTDPDVQARLQYYRDTGAELWAYNGAAGGQTNVEPARRRQLAWQLRDMGAKAYGYWNTYVLEGSDDPRDSRDGSGNDYAIAYPDESSGTCEVRPSRRMVAFGQARDDMRLIGSVQHEIDTGTCTQAKKNSAQSTLDMWAAQVSQNASLAPFAHDQLINALIDLQGCLLP